MNSLYTWSWNIKGTLWRILGFSSIKSLPFPFLEALRVREGKRKPKGVLIEEPDFRALLEGVAHLENRQWSQHAAVEVTALLWLLMDVGFRITEALSLHVGDYKQEDRHGGELTLPELEEGLKTGPRPVYTSMASGALHAWLSLHPAAKEPSAPLFPGLGCSDGLEPLAYSVVNTMLLKLGEASGVNARRGDLKRRVCAHDFRHTAATRDGRAGMDPFTMCQKYGWAPGSKIMWHYVHMNKHDLRRRARQDAGVDELGFVQTPGMDDATQLAMLETQREAILARLTAKARQGNRPPIWRIP